MLRLLLPLLMGISFAANCEISTRTIFLSDDYREDISVYLYKPKDSNIYRDSPHGKFVGKLFSPLLVFGTDFPSSYTNIVIPHIYTLVNNTTKETYQITETLHVLSCQLVHAEIDAPAVIDMEYYHNRDSLEVGYFLSLDKKSTEASDKESQNHKPTE